MFPVEVEIQNEAGYGIDVQSLERAVQVTAQLQEVNDLSELTIVITDDESVAALNRRFRGVDSPTDVLSFPGGDDDSMFAFEGEPRYLGDLVIAFPFASAQAAREGHDLNDSLSLLVVHGVLHLLGYDHDSAESRAEMWHEQEQALNALNISPAIVPALENSDHGQAE